jgi:hypothetical protein
MPTAVAKNQSDNLESVPLYDARVPEEETSDPNVFTSDSSSELSTATMPGGGSVVQVRRADTWCVP